MAKINLLTVREVDSLPVGFYADGSNLFLRVTGATARQWVFRYRRGKTKQLGLGSTSQRNLVSARQIASAMRTVLADGGDPASVLRRHDNAGKTFRVYAEELMGELQPTFRSAKHAKQWPATLERYAYPVIGSLRPGEVTVAHLQKILRPIWATKTETAERVRLRVETALNFAFVKEGIEKRNPAAWKGNLEYVGLGVRRKRRKQPMAPYSDLPAIMSELRADESIPAMCLRFIILTWVRSGEARGAEWSEISERDKLWTIPAHRMKAGAMHQVPLCDEALEILSVMRTRRRNDTDHVFPGRDGGLLSDTGVNKVLHALPTVVVLDQRAALLEPSMVQSSDKPHRKPKGATVHGMRASARSWGASAQPSFDRDVLEMALAHTIKDKSEAAYQRDPMIEKRRHLMMAWENYCRTGQLLPFALKAA
jgi:integrase